MIKTLWRLLFFTLAAVSGLAALLLLSWTGILGAMAEQRLKEACDAVLDFYNFHREAIQRALPWIGAIGSGLWAAFVFARAWHYADATLPERLAEYNRDSERRLVAARSEVLAAIRLPAQPLPTPWQISNWINARNTNRYIGNLNKVSAELDQRLDALSSTSRKCSIERATTHLALALRHEQQATACEVQGAPPEQATALRVKARAEFRHAAKLDPDALSALSDAVNMSKRLNEDDEAIKDLTKILDCKTDGRLRAHALYQRAEILFRQGADASCKQWSDARDDLSGAKRILQPLAADQTVSRLLARIHELLGQVQAGRFKFTAARTELRQSIARYSDQADIQRVQNMIDSIDKEDDELTAPGNGD